MLDYQSLFALAAVVREGSFERAARVLNVTPSAISQRIKGLEERLGQVVIHRGPPATGTPAGLRLMQHLDQVRLLEQSLACRVVSHGRRIPARWHALRRHLAYLGRAGSVLRHRKTYRAFFCVQQFIALYACQLAAWLRLPLPPLFLQPLIYVPRPGLFGRLWRRSRPRPPTSCAATSRGFWGCMIRPAL